MKPRKSLRLFVLLLAPVLGGACIAEAAGPARTPQIVVVTSTREATHSDQQTPDQTSAPDLTPTPTVLTVTMTAGQDLSCVTGPDWKLYDWVTRIHEGETVTLIARAVPEIPDYYVARTGDGKECWAFGGSSSISGPVDSLPVRETPPLPEVNFVVRNRVYIPLESVYIRPAGETAWGGNWLPVSIIGLDSEVEIPITAGYYDVSVIDVYDSVMYQAFNRPIGAEDTYRILEVATDVEVTFQNNLSFNICRIEIQHPWGSWEELYDVDDAGLAINPGTQKSFTLRAGTYGLRATSCDHSSVFMIAVYIFPGMDVLILT